MPHPNNEYVTLMPSPCTIHRPRVGPMMLPRAYLNNGRVMMCVYTYTHIMTCVYTYTHNYTDLNTQLCHYGNGLRSVEHGIDSVERHGSSAACASVLDMNKRTCTHTYTHTYTRTHTHTHLRPFAQPLRQAAKREWGSGFRVQGLGFGVWGLGFVVCGLWFGVCGLGYR